MLDASAPECPWCSASLAPGQTVCSSCGANLSADDKAEIPGVTEIDKAAVGVARPPAINNRSRWRAWISGDSSDTLTASEAKAVAPPDVAVRQEMLRLELQAHVARLQAEADALLAAAADAAGAAATETTGEAGAAATETTEDAETTSETADVGGAAESALAADH